MHAPIARKWGFRPNGIPGIRFGIDTVTFFYAFIVHDFSVAAEIASVLGHWEDACIWKGQSEFYKKYFNYHFLQANGSISNDTQGAYALAIQFDIIPHNSFEATSKCLLS